jgi:uncharacterized membrane protein YraQ (UPF0718 family)
METSKKVPKKTKSKKGRKTMDTSFFILCGITIILIIVAYWKKGWHLPFSGLVQGGRMFWDIAPNLLLGFALAGIVQVLIPREYVAKLLGEGSGFKGMLIATVAGAIAPGGPFINVPLVASFYKSGASVGPLAAFLTAWGIIPITRTLIYEIPLMGNPFSIARYAASLVFPFVIGIITSLIFRLFK